jgi:glyoxylase-like metal-dependent hydrolase (beta-lactamase superfamily II)
VLETPGHTPESISILIYDLDISDVRPHGVLTGDTLFISEWMVRRSVASEEPRIASWVCTNVKKHAY